MRPDDIEEKPPILHIKKDAERDVEFHYSREKRLLMESAPKPREIKGFLSGLFRRGGRGGRGLSPLFPVFIAGLAIVLVFRFAPQPANRAEIAGFQAVLRASIYGDSLLVSVSFTRGKESGHGPDTPTAENAFVRFMLSDTGEELLVSQELSEDVTVLRGSMPYSGKEKKIIAEVSIGGTAKTLTLKLPIRKDNPAVDPAGKPRGKPGISGDNP